MPDPTGFLRYGRRTAARRPVPVRIQDWREVYQRPESELVREQATRCMDCGVPFCMSESAGCPLGNRIPDWNDLVRTDEWHGALDQLHATNNFPEFTGRLCPAPCEAACVLGIADDPVTIKQIEQEIIDRGFDSGWVRPAQPAAPTGHKVAVIGSGPAGLAAAQQLARAGHAVTVYERDDQLGGLLRYGIPDFKLEKHQIDRRIQQMRAEGVAFVTGTNVGVQITGDQLRHRFDAILLATGALAGRDMPDTPGRDLAGVHLAMDHLIGANEVVAGKRAVAPIDARGKRVVIIGGGDTGADCLGVAHRQGATSVVQLDRYPTPPASRDSGRDPWPTWPWMLREYPAHEEGGERVFAVAVQEFSGSDRVEAIRLSEVTVDADRKVNPVPSTEREILADLVLLAIGFAGTEPSPLLAQLGLATSGGVGAPGILTANSRFETDVPGVFVAGDAKRGASLIVWAIAEGRQAAQRIHESLAAVSTAAS